MANIKFRKRDLSEHYDDSDKDETFKPSVKDNNSTDTYYSANLSETEKQDQKFNKKNYQNILQLLKEKKAKQCKENMSSNIK